LLLALARPPADLGWLAVVALVPLCVVWMRASVRGAACYGFVAGIAYYAVLVSWAWYFGSVALGPFVAVLATYWAATGAMVALARTRGLRGPLVLAAVWILGEALLARWPFGGFSWGEVGYAAHDMGPLRALGALGGLPLVSFVFVWANAALAQAWCDRDRPRRAARRVGVHLAAMVALVGAWFIAWPHSTVTGSVHYALIQGNDKDRYLTDSEIASRYLPVQHFALATELHGRYDLVVFPESSLDADPRTDAWLAGQLRATAQRLSTYVLANATVDADAAGRRVFNLDLFYDRSGELAGTYAKRHLVPFGEWVPWRTVLARHIRALDQIPRDFEPGHTRGMLSYIGIDGHPHPIGTLICFESAFGYQVRPLVRDGAQLLVVSTNNRSYRRSANSAQHVAIAQLRAVETGRAVLQAAISGHSAVITARGDLVAETALFHNGILTGTVPTLSGTTPYVRFGEWVLQLDLLVLGLGTIEGTRRRAVARRRARAPLAVDSAAVTTAIGEGREGHE
jgi:apolipoprotein N-acyltransferase